MANKKTTKEVIKPTSAEIAEAFKLPVIHKAVISHAQVDFGREDLNNLGKKVNEIIDHLNNS